MREKLTKFIKYLFRSPDVDNAKVEYSEADAYEIYRELGILFEAEEGEGMEFFERLEKEHPNSRIYVGKHRSRIYGLVFPEGYTLQEWVAHRGKEVLAGSEIDSDNAES